MINHAKNRECIEKFNEDVNDCIEGFLEHMNDVQGILNKNYGEFAENRKFGSDLNTVAKTTREFLKKSTTTVVATLRGIVAEGRKLIDGQDVQ